MAIVVVLILFVVSGLLVSSNAPQGNSGEQGFTDAPRGFGWNVCTSPRVWLLLGSGVIVLKSLKFRLLKFGMLEFFGHGFGNYNA